MVDIYRYIVSVEASGALNCPQDSGEIEIEVYIRNKSDIDQSMHRTYYAMDLASHIEAIDGTAGTGY